MWIIMFSSNVVAFSVTQYNVCQNTVAIRTPQARTCSFHLFAERLIVVGIFHVNVSGGRRSVWTTPGGNVTKPNSGIIYRKSCFGTSQLGSVQRSLKWQWHFALAVCYPHRVSNK